MNAPLPEGIGDTPEWAQWPLDEMEIQLPKSSSYCLADAGKSSTRSVYWLATSGGLQWAITSFWVRQMQ